MECKISFGKYFELWIAITFKWIIIIPFHFIQITKIKQMWKKYFMNIFHFTRWPTRICNPCNINCSSIFHFCAKNNAASSTIQSSKLYCAVLCLLNLLWLWFSRKFTSFMLLLVRVFFCSVKNHKKFFRFYVYFLSQFMYLFTLANQGILCNQNVFFFFFFL